MLVGLLATLLVLTSVFLILLVLVQRGRGGGLAGALGGMGGQSAFGTKAGDLFTRITIVVAAIWILLCIASVKLMSSDRSRFSEDQGGSAIPAESTLSTPAADSAAARVGETAEDPAPPESGAPVSKQ